jgi:hypothetical protein
MSKLLLLTALQKRAERIKIALWAILARSQPAGPTLPDVNTGQILVL